MIIPIAKTLKRRQIVAGHIDRHLVGTEVGVELAPRMQLLRDEAAVNQRLAWISQGVYQTSGRKGAEALVAKPAASAPSVNPSLDVEIQQNGGSRVVPTTPPAQK